MTSTAQHRGSSPATFRTGPETKPAAKTTELIAYVLTVVGVLVASALVDANEDGEGFGAERAWFFITLLTIGYMVSRGLAKAGSRAADRQDDAS